MYLRKTFKASGELSLLWHSNLLEIVSESRIDLHTFRTLTDENYFIAIFDECIFLLLFFVQVAKMSARIKELEDEVGKDLKYCRLINNRAGSIVYSL